MTTNNPECSEKEYRFLKQLNLKLIKWNVDDLHTAFKLRDKGILEYKAGYNCEWFEITKKEVAYYE